MDMYLTFDDSTQKQELLRCWSEIYFSLTTVHFLHTRSTTFKLLPTLSPDPHGDLSAKARSRQHSSNHHKSTTTHWKFTYLGSTISQNALIDDEISARIVKASGSFGKLTKLLWSERGVRLVTKINVYCAVVLPTLLYGCEAWTPYRRHIRRLDQFHMRCLRRIANIKWQDMIPNTEVLERCAQTGIEQHIKRAQLRWSGHLVWMADDRIPKDVFYGELGAGHRTRGGQRKRYKDVLKATLKSCSIPHNTWEATATDRALCRSTCHSGLRDYGEKRCDALRDKRMRRKAIQPSSNIDTFLCHVCGRLCA